MNPFPSPRRRAYAAFTTAFISRAAASIGVLISGVLHAAPVEADTTEAFIDSIGVNVHWAYTAYKNHYSLSGGSQALKLKLGELGVRHVRDAAVADVYPRAMDLYNTYGIKTTFLTGRRFPGTWPKPLDPLQIPNELNEIKTQALAATAAIEGPNEYDISRPAVGNEPNFEPNWVDKLRTYHQTVYNQARAPGSTLQNIPIVGPSLTSAANYTEVGSLDSWINYSCIHHYQTDRHPGTGGWGGNGYGSITWAYNYLANVQSPSSKPVQSTECGYHQSLPENGLSETADAKYTPRMFAEFYRRGYFRSFKYELMNMGTSGWESLHGLLRNDLGEKPAFTALKSLIALLKEPGADFVPSTLDYALSGATTNVRQVLLQKSNGEFYLLLWKEVSSWDPGANVDITVPTNSVTLTFNQPVGAATLYTYNASFQYVASTPVMTNNSVVVNVPDTVAVLKLVPFELVLDNTAASGVTITGSWTASTMTPGYYGGNYIHDGNVGKGTKSVRFTPNLPLAGTYQVFARWTAGANRANNVPIDITHAGGTATVTVNEQTDNGVWRLLGTYNFNAGTGGNVLVRTTGTSGTVVVDAVKLVAAPPWDVILDNTDASGVTITGSWTASTTTPGYYGGNYIHDGNAGKGSKSVRFTPNLPSAGTYQVFARWTAGANRANNVPVDITHAGGTATVTVNEQANGGTWYPLGTYGFTAGTGGNALVRTTGTSGTVVVDAVRFLEQ